MFVGLLGATATALSQAAAHGAGVFGTVSLARPSVVVLAMASAFFLAGGVLRLARWRIVGEPHSALAGAALLVMGGLCLPLGGLALLFPGTQRRVPGGAGHPDHHRARGHHPARARPHRDGRLAAELPGAGCCPGSSPASRWSSWSCSRRSSVAPHTMTGMALPAVVLAGVRALAWFAVALYAATRATELLWARRVAPLLIGMGFAEALRGLDLGRSGAWTFAALLVCLSMAALSTRAALIDLEDAVSTDERGRSDLSQALTRVSQEAVGLTEWREQLTHDARNACAGLRAALSILERQDGRIDPARGNDCVWPPYRSSGTSST